MRNETLILPELMFHAERFCARVEALALDSVLSSDDHEELRLKISQCRNSLSRLQEAYNQDQLNLKSPSIRAEFRNLVTTLMWVGFGVRQYLDRRTYRMLVLIESTFTYLLVLRR